MARCTCKGAPRKPHKVSRKWQQYKAEGVKCLIHFCSREKEREEKEGWRGGKKKRQRSRHSPATCHIPRQESSQRKEPFLQEATAAQESLLNPLRWREPARLTRGFQSGMEPRPCPLSPKKENKAELIKEQVLPSRSSELPYTWLYRDRWCSQREFKWKGKAQNARMSTATGNAVGCAPTHAFFSYWRTAVRLCTHCQIWKATCASGGFRHWKLNCLNNT